MEKVGVWLGEGQRYEWLPQAPGGQSDWCFQLSEVLSRDQRRSAGSSAVLVGLVVSLLLPAPTNQQPTAALFSQVGGLRTSRPGPRDRKEAFPLQMFSAKYFHQYCKVCTNTGIPQSSRAVEAPLQQGS